MTAARGIVKKGGAIVIAAECRDGVPTGSSFQQLLSTSGDPAGAMGLLAKEGFSMPDQWQVQMQAQVQLHARVFLYSTGLRPEEIQNAMLIPCLRIEDTIEELMHEYGPGASICVLPEGPETIPYLSNRAELGE
jgi:nickel-dependent lactate racemase